MRLVVDSNRIIAALIKDSASRKILMDERNEFLGLYFSRTEVKKYENAILAKAKISMEDYLKIFDLLFSRISLYDENDLEGRFLRKAYGIMKKIDEADAPFLALALQEGCPVWSDDRHFLKQKIVRVISTKSLAGEG